MKQGNNKTGQPKKYIEDYYKDLKQIKDVIPRKDDKEVRDFFKKIKSKYLKKRGK